MIARRLDILVVDDDPVFAETVRNMLREMQHEVTVFNDSQAAWDALSARHFDLLLLDCGLQGLSELTLLNRLQSRQPRLPVIIVSARRWPMHHHVMRAYGAAEVLEKPITQSILADSISHVLAADDC